MRLFYFLLFIFYHLTFFALEFSTKDTYYNHLYEVNKEWKKHKSICPEGLIKFNSEKDRISFHLKLVCNELVKNTPSFFSKNQIKNRYYLILELLKYADNSIFPTNLFHQSRTPYFIDYRGVHCAVGYLMKQSGHEELALKIKKEHNYDYVKDIDTEGVLEWGQKNGFLIEELKWIQPTYPQQLFEPIQDGTNNRVVNLTNDYYNNQIIISGEFDTLNNFPCLSIGVFKDEQFSCIGNGLTGQINDVVVQDSIFACGEIINGGNTYPLAIFKNSWSYYDLPNITNAIATAGFQGGNGYKFEICVFNPSNPNRQEIWYLNSVNVWEKKAEVNGVIYDIEASSLGRVYAGVFDSVFIYNNNLISDTVLTKNVIIKSGTQSTWFGVGNDVPEEVYTIEYNNSTIYFGGKCSNNGDVCVTRYLNNTLQPLLLYGTPLFNMNPPEVKINCVYFNNTNIVIGGDFIVGGFNSWGRNLCSYNLSQNITSGLSNTDSDVNTIINYNNSLFIGGDFTQVLGEEMNHIARKKDFSSITENKNISTKIYPNPTVLQIEITSNNDLIKKIEIHNMLGQSIYLEEKVESYKKTIDISNFKKGTYYVSVTYQNKKETLPIIKQ